MQRNRSFLLLTALLCLLLLGSCSRLPEEMRVSPAPILEQRPKTHPDESLTAVMTQEELASLESYPNLRTLDLSGSICYDAILAYMAAHPEVDVTYTVDFPGGGGLLTVNNHETALYLPDTAAIDGLAQYAVYLPALKSFELAEPAVDREHLETLRFLYPDASVHYTVDLLGSAVDSQVTELDLSALTPEQVDAVIPALQKLFLLESVELRDASGVSLLSSDDVARLSQACPDVAFRFGFVLFGQAVSTGDERLEFVNAEIGNEGVEQLRAILPSMTRLNYLLLDDCGVDNETMAQLRDDFPQIKVVWRIHFGKYNCLTDTEMIWATGGTVNDSTSGPLQYCTDVKYLDLGHDLMTRIEFVRCMPKLEVAIFAISWVADISPLADCPNLEYLEIFSSEVTDITPLANCTHLQHLNISNLAAVRDISCLYGLTELKRLYCTMSYIPKAQQEEIRALLPDCEFEFGWVDPAKGAWRYTPDGERNERYALLCEQFGYDTFQQSGTMWSLYD